MIGIHLWGAVGGFFEIHKSVKILPVEETQQINKWPVVYVATHLKTGKPILIVDSLLTREGDQPESYTTTSSRLLCLIGVERFIIINDVTSVNRLLKSGDLCLIKDHSSSYANNPLVGKNIEAWGTRFPDVSKVYKKGETVKIRKNLESKLGIRSVTGLFVPTLKGYNDAAEKKLAREALPFEVVLHKGAAESLVIHHMSRDKVRELMFLGVVSRKHNDPYTVFSNAWASLAKFFAGGFDLMLA